MAEQKTQDNHDQNNEDDDEQEKPESSEIKEIREKFMSSLELMRKHNIPLPPNLNLHYLINRYDDRRTQRLTITPYLTEEQAMKNKKRDGIGERGKYWSWNINYYVESDEDNSFVHNIEPDFMISDRLKQCDDDI